MIYVDVILKSTDLDATIAHLATMHIIMERTGPDIISIRWEDGDEVVVLKTRTLTTASGYIIMAARLSEFYASNLLEYITCDSLTCDWRDDVLVDTGEVDEFDEPILAIESRPKWDVYEPERDAEGNLTDNQIIVQREVGVIAR